MPKPTALPRWATALADPGDIVEPLAGKKDIGWQDGEKPPHSYFNWLLNLLYLWAVYLDGLTGEALTWTAAHVFNSGITVNAAAASGDDAGTFTGDGTGSGMAGFGGASNGTGVFGVGGGNAAGVAGTGGGSSGAGVVGLGGASNGVGGSFTGDGTGSGVAAFNGDGANAIGVFGSATQGTGDARIGVYGLTAGGTAGSSGVAGNGGSTSGTGVTGTGGSTSGMGGNFSGGGTGVGVQGTGGDTGATGGAFVGGLNSGAIGVTGTGGFNGGGTGGAFTGGTNGDGKGAVCSGTGAGIGVIGQNQFSGAPGVHGLGKNSVLATELGAAITTPEGGLYAGVVGTARNVSATGGYGMIAAGDSGATPNRSAFRIAPQQDAPANASMGDLFVQLGGADAGKLKIYNGSDWVVVGAQT